MTQKVCIEERWKRTIENGRGRGDVILGSKSLSGHDGRLKCKAESNSRDNLVSDPFAWARVCVECVDEAAAGGCKAGAEDHERGEVTVESH